MRREPFGLPVGERRGAFGRSAVQQDGAWRQPAWSKSSSYGAQSGADQNTWQPKTAYQSAIPQGNRQSFAAWSRGGAGMGHSANVGGVQVSGVQRGMSTPVQPKVVASAAHETAKPSLFAAGDHVMHKKFGRGAVIRVTGSGSDARIMIRFDDTRVGVKEFALSIAPIIKMEG